MKSASKTTCSVRQCKTQSYKEPPGSVSFFFFPKAENLRNIWKVLLGMKEPLPKYTTVCSKHFRKSDFTYGVRGYKRLRKGAIPTQKLPDDKPIRFPKAEPTANSNILWSLVGLDHELPKSAFISSNHFDSSAFFKIQAGGKPMKPGCLPKLAAPLSDGFFHSSNSDTESDRSLLAANNTQLDKDDSEIEIIEPQQCIEDPPFSTDLFEMLKRNLEHVLPNEYWTAIFIPGRKVVVFNMWNKTSSTYSSFKKVVILPDMSYKIFLGKAEFEVQELQDQPLTAIYSLACVENLLEKVNNILECLGSKKMRVSDECRGFVPSTNLRPNKGLAGYCMTCNWARELNRKIKKVDAP